MKHIVLITLATLLGSACSRENYQPPVSTSRVPAMAVMIRKIGIPKQGEVFPKLVLAAWPDGRVVWSEDQQKGGPPFREAVVDPREVAELVEHAEKRGAFDEDAFRHSWFGPDSSYHSIWLSNGRGHTRVESWHELYERNPRTVVVGGSITGLDGRKREQVIARDKSEFGKFRAFWVELRELGTALIPKEGKPLLEMPELDLPHD